MVRVLLLLWIVLLLLRLIAGAYRERMTGRVCGGRRVDYAPGLLLVVVPLLLLVVIGERRTRRRRVRQALLLLRLRLAAVGGGQDGGDAKLDGALLMELELLPARQVIRGAVLEEGQVAVHVVVPIPDQLRDLGHQLVVRGRHRRRSGGRRRRCCWP